MLMSILWITLIRNVLSAFRCSHIQRFTAVVPKKCNVCGLKCAMPNAFLITYCKQNCSLGRSPLANLIQVQRILSSVTSSIFLKYFIVSHLRLISWTSNATIILNVCPNKINDTSNVCPSMPFLNTNTPRASSLMSHHRGDDQEQSLAMLKRC